MNYWLIPITETLPRWMWFCLIIIELIAIWQVWSWIGITIVIREEFKTLKDNIIKYFKKV